MNKQISSDIVQAYIRENANADIPKIAMGKPVFPGITGQELANQISARKKCIKKLPVWFNTAGIYYPPILSVEQCSSELTAAYKAKLTTGGTLIDLTGGYGVDSYYFSRANNTVTHCEINEELSAIASFNAPLLKQAHTQFICGDGLAHLKNNPEKFNTIYIDPARRSSSGKVFMLKDCTPNVIENLGLLLSKCDRLLIKTAPLLDISAGLKELRNVAEIHIVSVKNECKELVWVLEDGYNEKVRIVCTSLNTEEKQFSYFKGEETGQAIDGTPAAGQYLYEPDVALLKSGAFNLIAERYCLKKFHAQTHLYVSSAINPLFPGRIFKIDQVLAAGSIKKEKNLVGNVIVRNFPDKAAILAEKYHIKPDDHLFIIFAQSLKEGKIVIKATIIQHY